MLIEIHLVLLLFGFSSTTQERNTSIRYQVFDYKFYTNRDKFSTIYLKGAVINQEDVGKIKIVQELPVLQKGMLQITASTKVLDMQHVKLTEIEPGAFDEQVIAEEINLNRNELTTIRSGTFQNLSIWFLYLASNKIAYIEEAAISNMPNLTLIVLFQNKIARINVDSFINLPELRTFDIAYNELTTLQENCFDFMANNSRLFIDVKGNFITEIHPKAFDGIINIDTLYLSDNEITRVPDDIWTRSTRMSMLNLANNQFEELPKLFYSSNITYVHLVGNPLKCEVQEKLKKYNKEHERHKVIMFDENC